MASKTDQSSMMVRLPAELKRWLQHAAIDNHRSLNGEIVSRLEKSRTDQQNTQMEMAQ